MILLHLYYKFENQYNMKTPNLVVLLVTLCIGCFQCTPSVEPDVNHSISEAEMGFDSIKAKAYGADAYGMKKYVFAFLKKGPNRAIEKDQAMQLQKAHLENIQRLTDLGKLVLAGPFLDGGDIRGIYIFNVESLEEAKTLTETDPAIKAGSLAMELKEWYGSAALIDVNKIHGTLAGKSIVQ